MASCQLRYVVPSTQCLITRHIVSAISAAMTTALASACSSSCISRPRIGARVISTADIDNDEFSCCTFACSHWSHLQLSMFLYSKPTSGAHLRYLMHKLPYWSLTLCCSLCLKMHHSTFHISYSCKRSVPNVYTSACSAAAFPPSVAVTQELTSYQESRKLVAMPSPLEWLSYIFASGNLLAGPFFELRDYRDYIQRQGAWAGGFPSGLLPGVVRLLKALLCMAFHLRMTLGFNASTLESAWYYSQPLWSRCVSH